MNTPEPPSESTKPTSAGSNPSEGLGKASFQTTAVIKPWNAIGASILAFVLGEILFFVIFNFRIFDPGTPLDTFFLSCVNFLSWGLTGLVMGGFLTSWKRQWIWAGAFGAAGLVYYLFIDLVPLRINSLLQTAMFQWLPLGVVVGLAFGLVSRKEPGYRQPDPLPRLLIGGGVVFVIIGLVLYLFIDWTSGTLAPGGDPNPVVAPSWTWSRLFWQVIAGLLEGLGMGLLLELPHLRR